MKVKNVLAVVCTVGMLASQIPTYAGAKDSKIAVPYENFDLFEGEIIKSNASGAQGAFYWQGSDEGINSKNVVPTDRGKSVLIDASGASYSEFMKWFTPIDANAQGLKVSYALKMADTNNARRVIVRGTKESEYAAFNTDGTFSLGGTQIPSSKFKWEVNTWYDVELFINPITGELKVKIFDGSKTFKYEVTSWQRNNTGIQAIDLYTTGGNATKTYYDCICVEEVSDVHVSALMKDDFESYNISDTSLSSDWKLGGENLSLSFVEHNGGKALKWSAPENQGYNEASFFNEKEMTVDSVMEMNLDVMVDSSNVIRQIGVRKASGGTAPAIQINPGGSFYIVNNEHSSKFKFKENTWYSLNFLIDCQSGKTILKIKDGSKTEIVTSTIGSPYSVAGFYLLTLPNGGTEAVASTYLDNISIKTSSMTDINEVLTTFDLLNRNIPENSEANWGDVCDGWKIQNVNGGINGSASPIVVEARKAVALQSDNKTHVEMIRDNYNILADKIYFEADVNIKQGWGKVLLRGLTSESSVTGDIDFLDLNGDGNIYSNGILVGPYEFGEWYHMSAVLDRVNHTYDVNIINAKGGEAISAKSLPLAEAFYGIQRVDFYLPPLQDKEITPLIYIDSVRVSDKREFYSVDSSINGMITRSGDKNVYVEFNAPIDASNSTVTANGQPAKVFSDGFNKAHFYDLPSNTKDCLLQYEISDMFGNKSKGFMVVNTIDALAYDITPIELSKLTFGEGEIFATVERNTMGSQKAKLVFALYNKEGTKLISFKTKTVEFIGKYTISINVPENPENYSVKAFVLNDGLIQPIKAAKGLK